MVATLLESSERAKVELLVQVVNRQSKTGQISKDLLHRSLLFCLRIDLLSRKEFTRLLEQFFKPTV